MKRVKIFVGLVGVVILLLLLSALMPMPPPSGRGDFSAYWSAAYLLARAQDFSNPELLYQVETELAGWNRDFVMQTWNPPWLLALLVPLTFLPFSQASWLWLFINIGLIFVSAVWIWLHCAQKTAVRRSWWAPLIAFAFAPTLIALLAGQVNTLVLFGLVAYLRFESRHQDFKAGMALSLTLVKPHLVYVVLPIILLRAMWRRRWTIFAGLGVALVALTLVVFALRPEFVGDYGRSVTGSGLLAWQTPTLGGFLSVALGWQWAKFMGILILPLTAFLWWRFGREMSLFPLLNLILLVSIITAPFGWGYDAILLLLPLLAMVVWLVEGRLGRLESLLLALALLAVNGALFYLRVRGINEVYYFWLPIIIGSFYIGVWQRVKRDVQLPVRFEPQRQAQ